MTLHLLVHTPPTGLHESEKEPLLLIRGRTSSDGVVKEAADQADALNALRLGILDDMREAPDLLPSPASFEQAGVPPLSLKLEAGHLLPDLLLLLCAWLAPVDTARAVLQRVKLRGVPELEVRDRHIRMVQLLVDPFDLFSLQRLHLLVQKVGQLGEGVFFFMYIENGNGARKLSVVPQLLKELFGSRDRQWLAVLRKGVDLVGTDVRIKRCASQALADAYLHALLGKVKDVALDQLLVRIVLPHPLPVAEHHEALKEIPARQDLLGPPLQVAVESLHAAVQAGREQLVVREGRAGAAGHGAGQTALGPGSRSVNGSTGRKDY